jgi:hypothetical protein
MDNPKNSNELIQNNSVNVSILYHDRVKKAHMGRDAV